MKKIFYGFLLIFLDFNLNIDNITVGLIPDFLGYIVLVQGLTEIEHESELLSKAKSISYFMIAFSAICYAMDLLGISSHLAENPAILLILGIVSLVMGLYIGYLVIQAIKEIEIRYNCFLNSRSLNNAWTVMATLNAASYVMLYVIPAVSVVAILCSFVAGICFLVQLNKSSNLYISLTGGYNGTF